MPTEAIRTATDAEDLIRGLTFMGTGGGGRPDAGRALLKLHLDRGETLGWTDLAAVRDDAWACCAFTMGSTAPRPPDFKEGQVWPEYGERRSGSALPLAIRELQEYTGKNVSAVFALELGASNTPGPMHAAAELGLTFVDGEGCGRAVPEASQILPALHGHDLWPASICDEWGNVLVLKRATSLDVAEALGKAISIVSKKPDPYAFCGMACYLLRVADVRKMVIPGSISKAFALGRTVRIAREQGADPVAAGAAFGGGWVLFRGIVTGRQWENKGGYQIGTTEIAGTGPDARHSMRIWFKNENHITWLDDKPFVTSPDLIVVVNSRTGEPITNTYLSEGEPVAVIAMRAAAAYRSSAGISALGPRHFNFDLDYRPVEGLIQG